MKQLIGVLAAFVGTYGLSYILSLNEAFEATYSMLTVFVFLLNCFVWKVLLKGIEIKKKRLVYAFLLAFLFALSLVMGYQLQAWGITASGVKGKFMIAVRSACLAMMLFPFSYYLFALWEKLMGDREKAEAGKHWKGLPVFLITTAVIFLCWIPVFLAYYPAIMTFDFHRQAGEAARGFIWFNPYQPLAHTFLIWVAFQIGNAVGSLEIGMACYSIFQMLVLAVAFGYSCNLVYRMTRRKWAVVLMTIFFGIFPFISVLSVCVTKDIIFTALFLIFMCLFVERSYFFSTASAKKKLVLDIVWVLEGIVMVLFRNNALYALAVFAFFFIIMVEKKQKIRTLVICLALVIGGKGALEGIRFAMGTKVPTNKVEMFSVPIQQFGRVGYYQADSMTDQELAIVSNYVSWKIWPNYNAPLADTLKGEVGAYQFPYTWEGNYVQLFKDWVTIGLKYPNEYIDAFLALTCGYWFMDDRTWCEVLGYGTETRMGAIYTYNSVPTDIIPQGIAHESKLPAMEEALEEIVSGNSFYDWPVLSLLCKPALYVWCMVLAVMLALYFKQKKKLMMLLLPVLYFCTLLLGPVVQIRYIFTILAVIPLLFALLYYKEETTEICIEGKNKKC